MMQQIKSLIYTFEDNKFYSPKVQTTFDCLDSFLMKTKKGWNFHPAFDIRIILRFYHLHPHPYLMHLDVLEVLASLILYLLEQQ